MILGFSMPHQVSASIWLQVNASIGMLSVVHAFLVTITQVYVSFVYLCGPRVVCFLLKFVPPTAASITHAL